MDGVDDYQALIWGQDTPPAFGQAGSCPCCGRPAHWASIDGRAGWVHDALIDTVFCGVSE